MTPAIRALLQQVLPEQTIDNECNKISFITIVLRLLFAYTNQTRIEAWKKMQEHMVFLQNNRL